MISKATVEYVDMRIVTMQAKIADLEKSGQHFQGVECLVDLMELIKLRNSMHNCYTRGLI